MMKDQLVVGGQVGGGGFLVYLSQLDLASWSYIVGILVALVGLAAGLFWQWRDNKRKAELQKAILESIKSRGVNLDERVD